MVVICKMCGLDMVIDEPDSIEYMTDENGKHYHVICPSDIEN